MSINSYKKNVERGVAGPDIGVCLPASLEQISPNHSYRPSIYTTYLEFVDYLDNLNNKQRRERETLEEYEAIMERLVRPLGRTAVDNMILSRINTERGFISKIRKLHDNDYRVVVDIRYGKNNPDRSVHSVGLIPIERDFVTLVSTHVPKCLQGIISTEQLASRIAITDEPEIKGHPISTANVLAIPYE